MSDVARACEEGGADAIAIHGRTREQRYSKAADWDLVGRVAAERGVPVIGNGDILTPYEARERMARSGVRSVMLARGRAHQAVALPRDQGRARLAAHARGALRGPLALRGAAARALRRGRAGRAQGDALPAVAPQLLLPLRAAAGGAVRRRRRASTRCCSRASRRRPPSSPLERLLGDARPETHQRLAEELLASASRDEAHERALRLAESLPADGGGTSCGVGLRGRG